MLGGRVFLWDRKTGTQLHEIKTGDEAPDLSHAVWNHAASHCLMLATATDDGHICLWSGPLPQSATAAENKNSQSRQASNSGSVDDRGLAAGEAGVNTGSLFSEEAESNSLPAEKPSLNVLIQPEGPARWQTTMSHRGSMSSINVLEFDRADSDGEIHTHASGSRSAGSPTKGRSIVDASWMIPDSSFPVGFGHSGHPDAFEPTLPPSRPRPSIPSSPFVNQRQEVTRSLEISTRHGTLPPRAERAGPDSPAGVTRPRSRSPGLPIPSIHIVSDTDSDTSSAE